MTKKELIHQIYRKKSCLSVGLDTDIDKIPSFLKEKYADPVFEFNKRIIDHTKDLCVCYKLNIAFYESRGGDGWESIAKTLDYIPPEIYTIADAKRGDIGNTSHMYARAFFGTYDFDAVTVAPYMGSDSVEPFLDFDEKWVILLGLTSNKGSADFQYIKDTKGVPLYEHVINLSSTWSDSDQMMYVIGATHPEELQKIRSLIPHHFLLIPGVGKQGGTVKEVMDAAHIPNECGLLINSSRGIIFAGTDTDFAERARTEAQKLQHEMAVYLM